MPTKMLSRTVASSSTSLNAGFESTANDNGLCAVMVALRGAGSNNASSPKKSPAVRWPTSFPARHRRVTVQDHEELSSGFALSEDRFAGRRFAQGADPRDAEELVGGTHAEDRHLGEAELDVVQLGIADRRLGESFPFSLRHAVTR